MAVGNRRHERDEHGYGGQKFPKLKRTAKTTKKQLLKLTCKTCDTDVYRLGIRLRKLDLT
jgi:large subunit ribosomal protein L44e